jgi:hypothetical protein
MTGQGKRQFAVALGMQVTIDLVLEDDEIEHLTFILAADEKADFARGFLGENTALAQAILGKHAGEVVPYKVGDGKQVRIVQVRPSNAAPPEDTQTRRQETIRKAVDQSDRTNAMIFASSFSGKWGDYDPTSFTEEASQGSEPKDTIPPEKT